MQCVCSAILAAVGLCKPAVYAGRLAADCNKLEDAYCIPSTLQLLTANTETHPNTQPQDVVALIAYESPEASPLAHLLSMAQREKVADAINAAVLSVATAAAAGGKGGGNSGSGGGGDTEMAEGGAAADVLTLEQQPVKVRYAAVNPACLQTRGLYACMCIRQHAYACHLRISHPTNRNTQSSLERLLAQLVAVQGALHEEAGGRGAPFELAKHLCPPSSGSGAS